MFFRKKLWRSLDGDLAEGLGAELLEKFFFFDSKIETRSKQTALTSLLLCKIITLEADRSIPLKRQRSVL